jgi:hypothetical protein
LPKRLLQHPPRLVAIDLDAEVAVWGGWRRHNTTAG